MKNQLKINPGIIQLAQNTVQSALENGVKDKIKMPSPLESLRIVIDEEPESFLMKIPISPELTGKVNSIYILTSLDE